MTTQVIARTEAPLRPPTVRYAGSGGVLRALLILLVACSNPPEVNSLDPKTGAVGDTITITGDHFARGTTAKIGSQPVADLTISDKTSMTGTVPEGLEPGRHSLSLTGPSGKKVQISGAFTIQAPVEPLVLCAHGRAGYAKTMLAQERIRIARYKLGKEDDPDITDVRFRDIDAIEYEGRLLEDGRYCSAILLRLNDGQRLIFEDATETNLRTKAQNYSQTIGRHLDLVHEDPLPEQ